MTTTELIARLQLFHPEANVTATFDAGFGSLSIDCAWLASTGDVVLGQRDDIVARAAVRPDWAPSKEIEEFWHVRNQDDV